MSLQLEKTGSIITNGIYTLAFCALALAVLSFMLGKMLGGNDRKKQKLVSNITWAMGIILMTLLLLPKLFTQT